MLEGIICPNCGASLEDVDIKESLTCRYCKVNLKDRKYLDFLEYLMANGLIEDLDFFDQKVYSEDVERLEPDDEEDVDPAEFEKKKIYSVFTKVRWKCINKKLKMKKSKAMKISKELKKNGKTSTKEILKIVKNNL